MRLIPMILAIAFLTACGGGSSAGDEPEGVIPDHMLNSMDKAENVEDLLQQQDQARREQIDSGG